MCRSGWCLVIVEHHPTLAAAFCAQLLAVTIPLEQLWIVTMNWSLSLQQLSGLWYHTRTYHPDVFAAQNHRSSRFFSLQCSSCDKTFASTADHRKHVKAEHTGNSLFVSLQKHMMTSGRLLWDKFVHSIYLQSTVNSLYPIIRGLVLSQHLAVHMILASPFPALSPKIPPVSICGCGVAEVLTKLFSRSTISCRRHWVHTSLFMVFLADVKLHECEICKELFPTLALLQVHVKCRHSGVLLLLLFTLSCGPGVSNHALYCTEQLLLLSVSDV